MVEKRQSHDEYWEEEESNDDSDHDDDKFMKLSDFNHLNGLYSKDSSKYDEDEILLDDIDKEKSTENDIDLCLTILRESDYDIKLFKYLYPIPEDPGLTSAFWKLHSILPSFNSDGIEKFKYLVDIMKLRPIQQIPVMLKNDKIDLKYYRVNPRIVRAICEALFDNTNVKTLDLEGNWLTVDACFHLNQLLVNNQVLTYLNLSGCRIGVRGAKRLQEGIGAAPTLYHLDVSSNDLSDEGLKYITTGVHYSSTLQIVNLRNNKLGDDSAIPLQRMLIRSDTLINLDLSWNSLFSYKFWTEFVIGLVRNVILTNLDLSWNSLDKECTPLLMKYLSSSLNIRELNLSGNRFEAKESFQIAEVLMKNTVLERLQLGNNPIQDVGAFAIIRAMTPQASPYSQLRSLGLENVWASKDVIPLLTQLKNERPFLDIKLGGILNNYKVSEPDARKIFLKRANFEAMKVKKKKQRKDFGQFILSLEDSIISKEEFERLVQQYRLKLRKSLIMEIMNSFTNGGDSIDQSALKKFYLKEYPNTYPTTSKPKKRKRRKEKISKNQRK